MGIFKVYIGSKESYNGRIHQEIVNLGIRGVDTVRDFTVYWFSGITKKELSSLVDNVLYNSFTQTYYINQIPKSVSTGGNKVEIISNLGVIDPRESSVKKSALDLGIKKTLEVKFGKAYFFYGNLTKNDSKVLKKRLLIKEVIEHEVVKSEVPFVKAPRYRFKLIKVPIRSISDKELLEISEKGGLSLNLEEMRKIKFHFEGLGRDPTDAELETIAQTWSEHCSHKTLKGSFTHNEVKIENLLKSLIIDPSEKLKKPYVVSAFKDNAGGVKMGENVICIKVETHNHPSAIEPVGGAETGTGGVIRDILGFGKGAKPISSIVCFGVGPMKLNYRKLPAGALHPKAILFGVVQGTKNYGNQMGIPTDFFQESLVVHRGYIGNPLVYCGTIGITDLSSAKKSEPKRGDMVVLLGGFTGRDGIHGATFSSTSLEEKSEKISSGSVQIGDAIMEKKVLDAILEMKDKKLISWITDCGGGGLSSAVGETGAEIGVRVNLEKVPKKYEGLSYSEIWISESQERMIVVSNPKNKAKILRICGKHNVPVVVIGTFTGDRNLKLFYEGRKVADLEMDFLHNGCPKVEKVSSWEKFSFEEPILKRVDLKNSILRVLADPDIGSKQFFAHQYDSTVQGKTIVGPLGGYGEEVHTEATIRRVNSNSFYGIAVSISVNPNLTDLEPRKMAHWVITQSLAKLSTVGANVRQASLLDNFSWGSTSEKEELGSLVETLIGCKEALEGFKVPFISGKDSLNNTYKFGNQNISIPGTLLITAVAPIKDIRKTISIGFKKQGNSIYLLGFSDGNMGGSYFYKTLGYVGSQGPNVDFRKSRKLLYKVANLVRSGLVKSVSLVGKGGLVAVLAKASLATGVGVKVDLRQIKKKRNQKDHQIILSESGLQFVVEVDKKNENLFKKFVAGLDYEKIGLVGGSSLIISIPGRDIELTLEELKNNYLIKFI